MSLGLKDYKPTYSWQRPIANLKDFYYELKYSCQRFWRGYDDTYLFDLDMKLDELIPEALRWLRDNRMGSPMLENSTEDTCHEDWNKVLDEILYHFKESDEDTCTEKNEYEHLIDFSLEFESIGNGMSKLVDKDDPVIKDKWLKRANEIDQYREEHHKQAYLMVAEHIGRFWD